MLTDMMTYYRHLLRTTLILSTAAIIALPSSSIQAEEISHNGNWTAHVHQDNGDKVCYMTSQPDKAQGNYKSRGDIFAFITHRPSKNSKNVFSYIAGYTYKADSEVTVSIDNKTFTLLPHGNIAWTPDDKADEAITDAIRKGNKMVVKGYSSRGTLTTDTFSLSGSGASYKAISEECGVKF